MRLRLHIGSQLILTLEMKKNNNDISRMTVIPVIFSSSPNLFKEICIWKFFFTLFTACLKLEQLFFKIAPLIFWGDSIVNQSLPEKIRNRILDMMCIQFFPSLKTHDYLSVTSLKKRTKRTQDARQFCFEIYWLLAHSGPPTSTATYPPHLCPRSFWKTL